jgi:hypothetical protein
MRHVIGLATAQGNEFVRPLGCEDRIRFDSDDFHAQGYYYLIAPAFEHFAQRDAGIGITSMNVMLCLKKDDLPAIEDILEKLEGVIRAGPRQWKELLGTVQYPNEQPNPINPLLFRSRALSLLDVLRRLVTKARLEGKWVVYGNGVCYRALCGIKLPPGTVEYS